MDEITKYFMSHQFTVLIAVFCAFFITWFIFKKLFKLALLVFLIFLGICGYFYLKNPDTARENIKKTLESAETKTFETLEKGKATYNKGKEYVEKRKKKIKDADNILNEDTEKTSKP
jgi:F0F1-type ATP synthase membrane subunit b/b'